MSPEVKAESQICQMGQIRLRSVNGNVDLWVILSRFRYLFLALVQVFTDPRIKTYSQSEPFLQRDPLLCRRNRLSLQILCLGV
jgi:hypothetical protein